MMTEQTYMSDLAIPPGEYLEEVLEEMDITQAELARRMGRPPQAINEILKGEKAISKANNCPLATGAKVSQLNTDGIL
ncbi:transcriptional regulator [Endozoicomonas sp. 8E]|uniref:helix-turn-helix transcriptional regulator n=1 Tax=Endozoicomonas sp. 8E TaxID=3035692 RepID=UPI002938F354|nr:helix-turn-helix domain-containing protein [Endozoicomonas sp. 8E]WOG28463.1 helix-turn-helix domain-containing protein [Endozoicomonas sp. 8E]